MPYDKDSFLTGLTVGRTLWKPKMLTSTVTPPRVWTADPEYLVYDAGTWLGSMNDGMFDRTFYKSYDGKAVAVFATYGVWHGPILLSTDLDAVRYSYPGNIATTAYLGLTWFYNNGYHLSGDVQVSTDLVNYEFESIIDPIEILQAANVRVWGV